MTRQLKHNKIKNTGILFELLTRQITVDVINGDDDPQSIRLLKKYFNETTELGKELQLYKVLLEQNFNSERKAEHLIDAVIKSRQKLKNLNLRREKYNLIKQIKETYNVDDFFRGRIQNFKMHASIYKYFLSESSSDEFDPVKVTESKFSIVEYITHRKPRTLIDQVSILEHEDKDLRLLTYQILVDKFNAKYKTLNAMQRNLLSEYINNISNTNSLREFIDSEVINVKSILKKFIPKVDNEIIKIKLVEAINQVNTISKGKLVKDNHVVQLMRYYELVKELRNVCK
jgi:hypothetical protein